MMNQLRFFAVVLMFCCLSVAHAQFANPVKVTCSIKESSPTEALITFSATIQDKWHMYGWRTNPNHNQCGENRGC